jgi:hypothetical protein
MCNLFEKHGQLPRPSRSGLSGAPEADLLKPGAAGALTVTRETPPPLTSPSWSLFGDAP